MEKLARGFVKEHKFCEQCNCELPKITYQSQIFCKSCSKLRHLESNRESRRRNTKSGLMRECVKCLKVKEYVYGNRRCKDCVAEDKLKRLSSKYKLFFEESITTCGMWFVKVEPNSLIVKIFFNKEKAEKYVEDNQVNMSYEEH